ncbi:hypothetical protein [Streptomyces sp. NPDC088785]|uniref:hypothetical protein n=1 Tax=Streptomyces sp. NPDC088785 TaxID=3365897 RepID=UPI003813D719
MTEPAWKAGLTAGRSQAGYRLVKENERLQKEPARYESEEPRRGRYSICGKPFPCLDH